MHSVRLAALLVSGLCAGCASISSEYFEPEAAVATPLQPEETKRFQVYAAGGWQAVGVQIRKGDHVRIETSGTVTLGVGSSSTGQGVHWEMATAYPSWLHGALLGRVARTGPPFLVGTGTEYASKSAGPLYMRLNDNCIGDNSGAFTVAVSLLESDEPPPTGEQTAECDLRMVRIADGSITAAATGRASLNRLREMTSALAEKLARDTYVKNEPTAVVTLRNRGGTPEGRIVADELADKLAAALVETGWFDVKERVDLRAILSENDLESAGIVNNPEVRAKLSGVRYIVIGGVTVSNRAE